MDKVSLFIASPSSRHLLCFPITSVPMTKAQISLDWGHGFFSLLLPLNFLKVGIMTYTSFREPDTPWALRRWMDHRAGCHSLMSSCTQRHPLAGRPRAAASWVQTLGNPTEGSTRSISGSVHVLGFSRLSSVPLNSEKEEDRLINPSLLSLVSVLREALWEEKGPGCP